MRDRRWLFRQSIRLYSAILLLYPRRFRLEFGDAMIVAFERLLVNESASGRGLNIVRPWRRIVIELAPTLLREHVEATAESLQIVLRSARLRSALRVALAALLPLGSYVVLLGWTTSHQDVFALTTCFLLMSAGMARARGRGWACSFGAMIGAVAAVGLIVTATGLTEVTNPNIILVAPLLAAAAATIALILATYVRLMIEGVSFSRRAVA